MKKFTVGLIAVIVFSSFSVTTVASSLPKEAQVRLAAPLTTVKAGEEFTLEAETSKQGSWYTDGWQGAPLVASWTGYANGKYISKAAFVAQTPGTYTITYRIEMGSGKSNTVFYEEVSKTVEVIGNNVMEVQVRDLSYVPVKNALGEIQGYYVLGSVYVVWSNGDTQLVSTLCVYLTKDQVCKDVDVKVPINGEEQVHTVKVGI